jgi:hypothetical protein
MASPTFRITYSSASGTMMKRAMSAISGIDRTLPGDYH